MKISSSDLRRIIRRQLKLMTEETTDLGEINIKAGGEISAEDVLLAAVGAAHELAKENIDNPEKFGLAAYAYTELLDASVNKKDVSGLSELSKSIVNFIYGSDPADVEAAIADGKKMAIKLATDASGLEKLGGAGAAEKAKAGEEKQKGAGSTDTTNDTTTGKPPQVTKGANSFQVDDKDAMLHFQEWLMTQPANKGKNKANIIDDDAKYGPKTHAAAVAALPDMIGDISTKNIKKLSWDTIKANKNGEMGDLALFIMLKKMPWNSEKFKGQAITKKGVEGELFGQSKVDQGKTTVKSTNIGSAGPAPQSTNLFSR